jgi:hypothetical protein
LLVKANSLILKTGERNAPPRQTTTAGEATRRTENEQGTLRCHLRIMVISIRWWWPYEIENQLIVKLLSYESFSVAY